MSNRDFVRILLNTKYFKKKLDYLSNYLQRQHRLKLLEKNTQVQKELEEDRRILEELEKIRVAEEEHDDRQREGKRNEIQWMKKVQF